MKKINWALSPGEMMVYNAIQQNIPEPKSKWYIFVEPYGFGDALVDLSLFTEFRKNYCLNGEKICFVTTSILGKLKPLINNSIDNWVVFDQNSAMLLYLYNELIAYKYDLTVGNPISLAPTAYANIYPIMQNVPAESHMDLKRFLLGLPLKTNGVQCIRDFSNLENDEYYNKIFKDKYNPKKSILIIPHAQSCARLPEWFWEELSSHFLKSNFTVFFDTFSYYKEAPKGAIDVKLSLAELVYMSRNISFVITYRSGLTDLVSNATNNSHACIYPSKDLLLHGYALCEVIENSTTNTFFGGNREISFFDCISSHEFDISEKVKSRIQQIFTDLIDRI